MVMKDAARRILRSKWFLATSMVAVTLACAIAGYYNTLDDLHVMPGRYGSNCQPYTDAPNGGNSQILGFVATDSLVKLDFVLNDGFQNPYVGMSFTTPGGTDASKYNRIALSIRGVRLSRVGLAVFTPPLSGTTIRTTDEALYHTYLNISDRPTTYRIPVDQLQHPEWWKDLHQMGLRQHDRPDFSKVLHVNIGSAYSPNWSGEKSLEVYSIAFTRDNTALFFWLGAIVVAAVCGCFGLLLWLELRRPGAAPVTVWYKPVTIPGRVCHHDTCIDYIHRNFQHSNLSLETISRETGMAPRRIAQTVHDRFGCNFKTYVNRIRIHEAKRLLVQKTWSMGEIAFQVGFNNQSHFNRVFKAETQLSPSEYVEKEVDAIL